MPNFIPLSDAIKHQLFTQLYEQFEDVIFILDKDLRYLSVNKAYENIIGYKEKFMIGRPLGIYAAEFLSESERSILHSISGQLEQDGFYESYFDMLSRYGRPLNCHIIFRKLYADKQIFYIAIVRDVSSTVEQKQRVTHLMNHNQLTDLPNRKVFLSQTSDLLIGSYQEVVVIRANIDSYRILINNFGQDTVDTLIKAWVKRMDELELENLNCFAHFGGDDFGLLFEFNNANMVRRALDRVMQICEQPFVIEEHSVFLRLSIGVSYYPADGQQMNTLLDKAEKALHYVKQQGGDDICWYHKDLRDITLDNLQLESELRQALKAQQFEPFYQPKIDLRTGEIVGFEALVRWRHPIRGLLSPKYFIEAVIKYKLSFELFCQVTNQVAQQLTLWQQMGFDKAISINADAAEFSHPEFFNFVSDLFERYAIKPCQIHLEITESSLMLRKDSIKQQIIALKALGITLALDDFGTGYASLSYLQQFPFDYLKIDKSFITDINDNRTQYAIVKAILDLAAALEMKAIAEGIETQQQRDLLLEMGCEYGQGYWFSHPLSADDATKMLI